MIFFIINNNKNLIIHQEWWRDWPFETQQPTNMVRC